MNTLRMFAVACTVTAVLAGHTYAGTQYRDRPFPVPPGGPLCFVKFDGSNVNAAHIWNISVDRRPWSRYEGGVITGGIVAQPPYLSLRITSATGAYFEIRSEDMALLKAKEAELLAEIKACK